MNRCSFCNRKKVGARAAVSDEDLLAHLPRIESARHQVDDDPRGWVGEAVMDCIGETLGRRRSACERFA